MENIVEASEWVSPGRGWGKVGGPSVSGSQADGACRSWMLKGVTFRHGCCAC